MERLQKYIASSGYTSRRKAEDLIREGRVSVNGQVVTELGIRSRNGIRRIFIKRCGKSGCTESYRKERQWANKTGRVNYVWYSGRTEKTPGKAGGISDA